MKPESLRHILIHCLLGGLLIFAILKLANYL